jgi:ADP-ribose pyrophosphatase
VKILEQKIEFQGKRIAVRRDRIVDASGRETTRELVVHPGAVSIVAMLPSDEVVLIHQYRHATGEELVEIPAGTLEENEDPIDAAHRELAEETGYSAKQLELRATYYTTPGFSNELMYLYEASGLTLAEQNLDEDETIEVALTPSDQALQMIQDGRIRDAKTIVGLLKILT